MMNFKRLFSHPEVEYYGLGEAENYIDRRCGAVLGNYSYDVRNNVTPYLYPQECGNRTGVRTMTIGDGNRGLEFAGNKFKIMTILVDPLGKKDLKITGLNRAIETKIIKYYNKRGLFERGKYYG